MSFTTVTVTETFQSQGGTAATGSVEFILSEPVSNNGVTVEPVWISVALDVNGAISQALVANDDTGTTPQGSAYTVVERIDGAPVREYQVVVPSAAVGGTVQLSTLMPGQPGFG